jgi:hypothetical protein
LLVSKRKFRSADRLDFAKNCREDSRVVFGWGSGNVLRFREGQLEERLTFGLHRVKGSFEVRIRALLSASVIKPKVIS